MKPVLSSFSGRITAKKYKNRPLAVSMIVLALAAPLLWGCADAGIPGARNLDIEAPTGTQKRQEAINEKPDSVVYLPLGSDVLVPETVGSDPLPQVEIGPFELRSETLAGALQLILADYEIPLAFETEEGLTRTITVANLRGPLNRVVERVCSLANLYCAYEDGLLVIKDMQTFTVTVPPIGGDTNVMSSLATGLQAITGETPIVDEGTRSLIYTATNRTAKLAERYFQRLRANTALIVYEVYIWEVSLDSANATGINWSKISQIGDYGTGINIPGGISASVVSTPISIGLPTTGDVNLSTGEVLEFISTYGAVKTVSQPQITMLSGGEATLRVAETVNYVSSLNQSVDDGEVTVSTETDSVDTGFTLTIASGWDNATVYGTVELSIEAFQGFENFDVPNVGGGGTSLRLPETSQNELSTQVRIRPGDSLLIAGLVKSSDQFNKSGPGFREPFFPTSRDATVNNSELVILMKPRVIVYTAEGGALNNMRKNTKIEPNPDVFSAASPAIPAPGPAAATTTTAFRPGPGRRPQNPFSASSVTVDMLDPSQ